MGAALSYFILDGPLQYDAASEGDFAAIKAPNSNVDGLATVFVFPDLNTGNMTYKAVQAAVKCDQYRFNT